MGLAALSKGGGASATTLPKKKGYYIYVTEACNLRCSYCFVREKRNQRHLTPEMADGVLRFIVGEAAHLTEIYVHFFGGEPLIQPGMVDYLACQLRAWEKENRTPVRLGVTTNGTLLTVQNCEMLKRHQIGVQLSLDGSQRGNDIHRQLMGARQSGGSAGAFHLVHIPNYCEYFGGQRPNCRMTLTVHNLPFLSKSIQELHALGFKSFSIIPDADCGAWTPEFLSQYEAEMQRVFEYWAAHRDIVVNTIDKTIQKLLHKTARTHLCRVGTTIIGITIDGDIYPCHDFAGRYAADPDERRTLLIGNVRNGYYENLANFLDLTVELGGSADAGHDCSACWAKWVCSHGCPYMNYARAGSVRSVNTAYCAMTRINASLALRWMSVLDEFRFLDSTSLPVGKKGLARHPPNGPIGRRKPPAEGRVGWEGPTGFDVNGHAGSVDSLAGTD